MFKPGSVNSDATMKVDVHELGNPTVHQNGGASEDHKEDDGNGVDEVKGDGCHDDACDASYFLGLLGSPGRYAGLVFVLSCITYLAVPLNHVASAVYQDIPQHFCHLAPEISALNDSRPLNSKGKTDECHMFANQSSRGPNATLARCTDGWDYNLPIEGPTYIQENTIVNEWDLVCERRYLVRISTTVYFLGVTVGGLASGALGDLFGRRPVIIGSVLGPLVFSLMLSLVQSFVLYTMLRFLIGLGMQALQSTICILFNEHVVSPTQRARLTPVWEGCFGVGVILLAAFAFFTRNWRYVQVCITIFMGLGVFYCWFIPESLRWLITKGKPDKALEYMERAAKFNKVKLPADIGRKLQSACAAATRGVRQVSLRESVGQVFRSRSLRMRTLVLLYAWFVMAPGYYMVVLNVNKLAGDKYLNYFINSLTEIGVGLSFMFIMPYFGRKYPIIICFLICGIGCTISGAIPRTTGSIEWLPTLFAWIAKVGNNGTFVINWLYTPELYPTVVRNTIVGMCAFMLRFGSTITPQLLLIGDYTAPWVPFIITGVLNTGAGLLIFLLPETKNAKMADTMEEAVAVEGVDAEQRRQGETPAGNTAQPVEKPGSARL